MSLFLSLNILFRGRLVEKPFLKISALACPSCNRSKACRQKAFDAITQQEMALFHPHFQLWTEHFAWSEDATEMIGLTSVERATISALKMNRPQLTRVRKMWVKMGEHPPIT